MRLGDDDMRGFASEARLSLTDGELESAVRYVNNFFTLADRLKELDLKNTEPFCFPESARCPLREDVPEPFTGIAEMLGDRVEPGAGAGVFFKVPRIMEE